MEYKIAHLVPFKLSDYMQPNKVNWYIDEKDIEWDKRLIKVIHWGPIPQAPKERKAWEKYHDFNFSMLKKSIERAKSNRQIHVYANLHCIRMSEMKNLFHELFKPTEELQALVDWNKEQIGGQYVSVTTRFQNLMGDFYEGKEYGELSSEEEKREYISKCIDKVEELHGTHPDKKILVTSDSSRFLNEAKRLSYVHVNPGNLVHMQYTSNASHEVYLKSFVDLFTIAGAEKAYLIRTGRMFKSGFAVTAAAINGRPYELIDFK